MSQTDNTNKYAQALLEDLAVNALLRTGRPLRTSELIAAMPGIEANRALLRSGLANSRAIVSSERRWDLATRHTAAGKTLDGMVDAILRVCAKPLPLNIIAREVGLAKSARAEQIAPTLRKFFRDRDRFVELTKDVYALEDWLLDTSANDEQAIILENRLAQEEDLAALTEQLDSEGDGDDDAEWALNVLQRASRPLSHRVLEFLRWRQFGGDFDPADLLATLHDDARFSILSGGLVCTTEQAKSLRQTIAQLAVTSDGSPSLASIDVESLLAQPVEEAEEVTLRPEEVDDIIKHVASAQMPVSVVSLVQDIFELLPDDASFRATLHAVLRELDQDGDFARVGRDRYLLRGLIPAYLYQMPDALRPIQLDLRTMQDERIDAELDDDGLDGDLAQVVHSLEWEESGEEHEATRNQPFAEPGEELTLPVNVLHRRQGTLKLRYKDDRFFPVGANVMRVFFSAGEHEFPVWISRETGLIYDLLPWFESTQVGIGHQVRLRKTVRPDRYEIEYRSEKHPLLALETTRLETLKELASKDEAQQPPLMDMLNNLLYDHPRGANFIRLWHEVNVIRRSSKRLVASVLSSYHCFYPRRQGDEWFWRLDEDKYDQGFKRNKRKNVRR